MHSNQYKASITLGFVAICFLISSIFYDSFIGSLLTAGFGAALVGGMADWFAVNALFRKPLGIGYKTEIIPRKREKIFSDIVDIVQNTLLSKENIKKQIARYSMSRLLLRYFEEDSGKNDFTILTQNFLQDVTQQLDPEETLLILNNIFKKQVPRTSIIPLLTQAIEWSLQKNYDDKIINFVLTELQKVSSQPQIRTLIINIIVEAQTAYEQDAQLRKLALYVFKQLGYTPNKLSGVMQAKFILFLDELKQEEHPLRLKLKMKLSKLPNILETNSELRAKIEDWVITLIDKKIAEHLVLTNQSAAGTAAMIVQQIDFLLSEFKHNAQQQQKVDEYIKQLIMTLLDSYHAQIGALVMDSLAKYNNDELVSMIESKVGNDLQIIRINGSIVGGITGIVLYLLTFWW